MSHISGIRQSTEQETESYLDYLGWHENPFIMSTRPEEYVLPANETIADIIAHIQNYTGPILIHSELSGVGKTTLVKVLSEELSDNHNVIYIGEHNVTTYELVSIIADETDVGKSSSTKLTERKLSNASFDKPVLLAIDEFGLNEPETIHTLQFLNDEVECKLLLTGMTSQWDAINSMGTAGSAFRRRCSLQVELKPFDYEQTREMLQRRIAYVSDKQYSDVDLSRIITNEALLTVHDKSEGVAGIALSAIGEAFNIACYQYCQDTDPTITSKTIDIVHFPDPYADISK